MADKLRTMPRAIVLALVRGWFFMNSRGTDRPIAAAIKTNCKRWIGSINRGEKKLLLRKSKATMMSILSGIGVELRVIKGDDVRSVDAGEYCFGSP